MVTFMSFLGQESPATQYSSGGFTEKTSIKDVIESCGVPHPEVDLILVDEQPVGFNQTLANEAKVEVFPVQSRDTVHTDKRLQTTDISRFVADGHLGRPRAIFVSSGSMSRMTKLLMTANC